MCYIDTREQKDEIFLSHLTKHYLFIFEESYLYGETYSSTRGSLRI